MPFEVDKRQDDDFELEDNFSDATKIMVFGVGGGGGNAVANMTENGITDVEYVIANTDVAALRSKDGSKMRRIQIGRKTTKGRGAGNNPEVGRASAEENTDEIRSLLNDVSMIFVAAGMGGGTGTGAAPVVSRIAKEMGILTVGVVTKPFKHEGADKMRQALEGIEEMKKCVDALIVIPNEKIKDLPNTKLSLFDAFKAVDDVLCKAVSGIITLLNGSGYINVDFADITMALKDSGIAHMAIGRGKGDNNLEQAIDEVVHSPLLETSIDGAKKGLLNVSIPKTFPMEKFTELNEVISSRFEKNAKFKAGIVFDDSLAEDELTIIAVATDFQEAYTAPEAFADAVTANAFEFTTPDNDPAMDTLLNIFNNGRGE